jgi:serine/threonine-protein kinase
LNQAKPSASEPTEIAGRYQIIKKLGAGAFGTVYKAKDRILGRMLAIKTIRLEGLAAAGAGLDELLERFKREAQVSAQLKHPNIVTIYDIGDSEGVSYLAMEFIDGVGLDRVIATTGRLPLDRAAAIAQQIADALDFAHKHGVVHRDIKPANIMMETGDRVKVTDFGIAKVTTSGEHLTMTGSLLGTPSYMSPEQARGTELDGRSDLFAVGCIIYEMLAGHKAFRGDSITGLIFKIITEEPPSIAALDPSIPEEMVRIIARALAKTPEARYQSGREIADDLAPFTRAGSTPTIRQTEMPTAAGVLPAMPAPPSIPTVHAPATVVSPGTLAGGTPTVATPPPRAGGAPRPPRSEPTTPPRAPAPAPRKSGGGAGLLIGLGLVGLLFVGGAAAGAWYFLIHKRPPATTVADASAPSAAPPSAAPATLPRATTPPTQEAAPAATEAPSRDSTTTARPPNTAPQRDTSRPPAEAEPTPRPRGAEPESVTPPARTTAEHSFLDEEPPETSSDGDDVGQRVPQSFGGRGSTFGGGRIRPRERSPRNLAFAERPAVAAIRHIINAEEVYKKRHNRYGSFTEMAGAQSLFLDVPAQATSFARKRYRFQLSIEDDGFKVVALPIGPGVRPFFGDDTGFIREGVE